MNVVTDVRAAEKPPGQKKTFWERHGARLEKWALALVPVAFGVLLTVWLVGK